MWWIIVALIFTGILLMFIEMLLIPGVGVAGVLSLVSLIGACWYAFVSVGQLAGIITTAVVALLIVGMLILILRGKTWKRFELKTEVDSKMNAEADSISAGDRGTALTRLAPMGTGKFGSICCEVRSADNDMIAAGTPIEVVEVMDGRPLVKAINE